MPVTLNVSYPKTPAIMDVDRFNSGLIFQFEDNVPQSSIQFSVQQLEDEYVAASESSSSTSKLPSWMKNERSLALGSREFTKVINSALLHLDDGAYQERILAQLIRERNIPVRLAGEKDELQRKIESGIAWFTKDTIFFNPNAFPFVKNDSGTPVPYKNSELAEASRVIAPLLAHETAHLFVRDELVKVTDKRAKKLFSTVEDEIVAITVEMGVWHRLRNQNSQPSHTADIAKAEDELYLLARQGVRLLARQIAQKKISFIDTPDAILRQAMIRELMLSDSREYKDTLSEQIDFVSNPENTSLTRQFFLSMMDEAERQLRRLP